MTVRLTIRTAIWRSQVARVAHHIDGLIPVVKGNGYGFGRSWLAATAAEFADTIAVGNVHELDGLPTSVDVNVLTPTLNAPMSTSPILTIGAPEHIAALAEWRGRVVVKLTSPMQRFGRSLDLVDDARAADLDVVGVSIHPPLAGTSAEHAAAVIAQLPAIDPRLTIWLSHLDAETYAALPSSHSYRLRLGTGLWHGNKEALHLSADVLDVRPVAAGSTAGYRLGQIPVDGHLVMIGAGTANGVTPIDGGTDPSLSPFHFERTRLALHEPPHMHTSMAFVPDGDPLPAIGDRVDVQRPLHMTTVDEFEWR